MRINSMTATFGKLHHEKLMLQPGLNVIEAPNEWGKSTWCAFLAAMLYGLDTRAKRTKTALTEKERYAPWSGVPMEGRLEICWQGREITIERRTRGRIPLGEFRAYETKTGMAVTELDGRNCGEVLLGVERSVFLRSCLIRLSDMPVTEDEALRQRLHALVTTGDESGAGERLAKGLKDLKNRCRYNKTGLLPQAEAQRDLLEDQLREMEHLEDRCGILRQRLAENENVRAELENHRAALAYHRAKENLARVEQARQYFQQTEERLQILENRAGELPDREVIRKNLDILSELELEAERLQIQLRQQAEAGTGPEAPEFARGMEPEAALEMAGKDAQAYAALRKIHWIWPALWCLITAAGIAASRLYRIPGFCVGAAGLCLLVIWLIRYGWKRHKARALAIKYPDRDPEQGILAAQRYLQLHRSWMEKLRRQADFRHRAEELAEKIRQATQQMGLAKCRGIWEAAQRGWEDLDLARRAWEHAKDHWQTLQAMAVPLPPAPEPDSLKLTAEETQRQLQEACDEQLRLQKLLSQYTGRMEALGDRSQKQKELDRVRQRIGKLEDTYQALVLAQDTLLQAKQELQRRFAPRIAKGAAARMAKLTDGRYTRLQLREDLSLLAAADQEDTLREALWRSDGTVDQLYLALRLSVAEALCPDAPLILDDALVRFDDTRLKAALGLLKEEARTRQVILFTCQSREKDAMDTVKMASLN